jgi:gentisate 1,2-dioxygenase
MEISEVNDVATFEQWMAERNLSGVWQADRWPRLKPCLWKWSDIYASLEKAGDVVTMDMVSRRDVNLVNPSTGRRRPSNTVSATLQYLLPGDVAKAHRHTAATARWVIQGDPGAFSVVEGEAFPVMEGDLLVAPSMAWHDHYHHGEKPTVWLSSLDNQFAGLFHSFGENYHQPQQAEDKPPGWSAMTTSPTRPAALKSQFTPPPYSYRWKDTYATLMALKEREEVDPYDGIRLEFRNPETGGPTFPNMACAIQLLAGQEVTRAHRHNSTVLFQAFRGSGVTVANGERLEWNQGDVFIVPAWAIHHHENRGSEDAILYSLSDEPVARALGFYAEDNDPKEDEGTGRSGVE